MSLRLTLARVTSLLFPPLLSNRLTMRYIFPYERARFEASEFRSRGVTGSYYNCDLKDVHAYMFAMLGYFDWRVIAVAGAVIKPGDVVIEVGANVGTETIALADLVGPEGKVYAIEPVPANLAWLRTLNERSNLHQVEVVPQAIADFEGEVEFAAPADFSHSGMGHIRGANQGVEPCLNRVPCTTLDALTTGRGCGPVRLIAIDAEGSEPVVLRGASRCLQEDQPVLILEACEPHLKRFGSSLAELHSMLQTKGYVIHQIGKLGLRQPDVHSDQSTNWVALPGAMAGEAPRIHRRLVACGLLPCLPGVNPLTCVAHGAAHLNTKPAVPARPVPSNRE
jgi:FkbM family methyltransferase